MRKPRNVLTRPQSLKIAMLIEGHWEEIERDRSLTLEVFAARMSEEMGCEVTPKNLRYIFEKVLEKPWPHGAGHRGNGACSCEMKKIKECLLHLIAVVDESCLVSEDEGTSSYKQSWNRLRELEQWLKKEDAVAGS